MRRPTLTLVLVAALFAALVGLAFAGPSVHAAPLATTYYSRGSLAPNLTSSWNTNRTGGGSQPANFTSGDVFVIQNGHNLTTSGTWSISGTGSKLWIENGGTLTASFAVTLATATTFQIDGGGTYVHNNTTAYGGTIFYGTEAFDAGSTVILNNSNTSGPSGVAFGNLTVNFLVDPGGSVNCAGGLTTINGNLTIQGTSVREFRLTGTTPLTLNIAGDLVISGGTLNLTTNTGAPTVNIGGNFNETAGTLVSGGSVSTMVFSGGSSSVATFSKTGGTLTGTNIDWKIASGKTLKNTANFGSGSWLSTGRSMTVDGGFQIEQGSWTGSSGTWKYGTNGSLIFNNTSGAYGPIDATHVYWPSSNGPTNVTVQGAGGINLAVSRTVSGVFQTAAGVTLSSSAVLTLNGTAEINNGGVFNNAPTYGDSSTLQYNTGGTYGRFNEWSSTMPATAGYPANVQIKGNTTVNYPNGSTAAQSMAGSLTIDSGSALYMDYGGTNPTGPLTVGGGVTLAGSLSLSNAYGGDIKVAGNWTNNGGSFYPHGRAVFLNGSALQTIGGTSATSFDYLNLNNGAGAALSADASVNNDLTLASGLFSVGAKTLTLASGATVTGPFDASKMIAADGGGQVCKTFSGTDHRFDFPIGDNTGTPEYSPVTLDFTASTWGQACISVTDDKHPKMPGSDYLTRYWTVTGPGFGGYACDFAFRYLPADVEGTESNLSGAEWDTTLLKWTVLNPVDTVDHKFTGVVSSFSQFSSGNPVPLAVEMAYFDAALVNGRLVLTWETVSEQYNAGFNVYRGATEQGPWAKVNEGLIGSAAPGASEGHAYRWTDAAAPAGTHWYLLEDVDLNGTVTQHGPVRVVLAAPNAVSVQGLTAQRDWVELLRRLFTGR